MSSSAGDVSGCSGITTRGESEGRCPLRVDDLSDYFWMDSCLTVLLGSGSGGEIGYLGPGSGRGQLASLIGAGGVCGWRGHELLGLRHAGGDSVQVQDSCGLRA